MRVLLHDQHQQTMEQYHYDTKDDNQNTILSMNDEEESIAEVQVLFDERPHWFESLFKLKFCCPAPAKDEEDAEDRAQEHEEHDYYHCYDDAFDSDCDCPYETGDKENHPLLRNAKCRFRPQHLEQQEEEEGVGPFHTNTLPVATAIPVEQSSLKPRIMTRARTSHATTPTPSITKNSRQEQFLHQQQQLQQYAATTLLDDPQRQRKQKQSTVKDRPRGRPPLVRRNVTAPVTSSSLTTTFTSSTATSTPPRPSPRQQQRQRSTASQNSLTSASSIGTGASSSVGSRQQHKKRGRPRLFTEDTNASMHRRQAHDSFDFSTSSLRAIHSNDDIDTDDNSTYNNDIQQQHARRNTPCSHVDLSVSSSSEDDSLLFSTDDSSSASSLGSSGDWELDAMMVVPPPPMPPPPRQQSPLAMTIRRSSSSLSPTSVVENSTGMDSDDDEFDEIKLGDLDSKQQEQHWMLQWAGGDTYITTTTAIMESESLNKEQVDDDEPQYLPKYPLPSTAQTDKSSNCSDNDMVSFGWAAVAWNTPGAFCNTTDTDSIEESNSYWSSAQPLPVQSKDLYYIQVVSPNGNGDNSTKTDKMLLLTRAVATDTDATTRVVLSDDFTMLLVQPVSAKAGQCLVIEDTSRGIYMEILPVHLPRHVWDEIVNSNEDDTATTVHTSSNSSVFLYTHPQDRDCPMASQYAPMEQQDAVMHLRLGIDAAWCSSSRSSNASSSSSLTMEYDNVVQWERIK